MNAHDAKAAAIQVITESPEIAAFAALYLEVDSYLEKHQEPSGELDKLRMARNSIKRFLEPRQETLVGVPDGD